MHNFLCIYALTIYGNAERERGDSVYALKTDQGNAYILSQVHIYIRERERERERSDQFHVFGKEKGKPL